jgi:hypothetical protein
VNTTFSISQPLTVNLGNDTTLTTGQFLPINAGSGASAYNWNTGSTSQVLIVNSSGTYSVVVTNVDGCTSTDTIVVNFVVGTDDLFNGSFGVYPNPSGGDFILKNLSDSRIESVQFTDISGRELQVRTVRGTDNTVRFDAEGLPSGIYYLRIRTATGTAHVRVMIE